jgi:hypothetical protein
MVTLEDLREAVSSNPELLKMVDRLHDNQIRLLRLLIDLGRLDDAIVQRVTLFQSIEGHPNSQTRQLADTCVQLLVTISSFIHVATTPADERAADAVETYDELMKRLMKR